MNKFRKLGLVDYNGEIIGHNSLLSVALNDNPHLNGQTGAIRPFVGPNREHSIDPCGLQQWSILYRLRTAPAGKLNG